jgi:hypothetical protein
MELFIFILVIKLSVYLFSKSLSPKISLYAHESPIVGIKLSVSLYAHESPIVGIKLSVSLYAPESPIVGIKLSVYLFSNSLSPKISLYAPEVEN